VEQGGTKNKSFLPSLALAEQILVQAPNLFQWNRLVKAKIYNKLLKFDANSLSGRDIVPRKLISVKNILKKYGI